MNTSDSDPGTPTTRSSSSTNTIPTPNAAALAVAEEYALVASNPRVQLIAARLKWRADTAVRRIKDALPAPLEQQIYLAIAPQQGESGILPESLAKLLRMFLGDRNLDLADLASNAPGRGRLDAFAEFLGGCI